MISALADAGAALERAGLHRRGGRPRAEFVLRDLRDADGRLLRTYNRGRAKLGAYLEDHAFLLEALLDALRDDVRPALVRRGARARRRRSSTRFADPEHGGFFATAADHERLVARRKDLEDTPIPSGASAAAFGLLRLAALTGEHRYEEAALGVLRLLHRVAPQHPVAFGHLLQALDFHLAPCARWRSSGRTPGRSSASCAPRSARMSCSRAASAGGVPLLAGREPVGGRAAAYVCEHFACRRPVTEPDELARCCSTRPRAGAARRPSRCRVAMSQPPHLPAGRRAKWVVLAAVPRWSWPAIGPLRRQVRGRAEERDRRRSCRATRSRSRRSTPSKQFPGGEPAPAVTVIAREGGLTAQRPAPTPGR